MPKTSKRKAVSNAKEEDAEKEIRKPKKLKVERKEMKEEPPKDIIENEEIEEETIEEEESVKKPRNKRVRKSAIIDGDPKSNLLWKRNPGMFKQLRQSDNKGVDLKMITYGSPKILNWWCDSHHTCNEHVWTMSVNKRTNQGTGCPYCSTSTLKKYCKCAPQSNLLWKRDPEIFKQLRPEDNKGIDLKSITFGSHQKLTWWCTFHKTCDEHVWRSTVKDRTSGGCGCPFCSEGSRKRNCRCTRPKFQNADGSQKPGYAEKMKRCGNKECRKEKPISEFKDRKDRKDGLNPFCNECMKQYKSITCAIRRLFFNEKKCQDCGEKNSIVFESDHVFDDKAKTKKGTKIKTLTCMSPAKLCLELKKTEVVCVNCHRIRTFSRNLTDPNESEQIQSNRKLVGRLKLERKCCANCPKKITKDNHRLFDFDHINRETKIERISKMIVTSLPEEIETEAKKCQALCCNCHRIKTASDMKWRTISDFPAHIIAKARKFLDAVFEKDAAGNYIHLKPGEFNGWSFRLIQHK